MGKVITHSGIDRRSGNRGEDGAFELLLQLSFPSMPDRLRLVRPMVRASAQLCGFSREAALDVVLAVDEACANIIEHSYGWRGDAEIILNIFRIDGGIQLQLRDFAPPVDLRTVHPRNLNDIAPGGLGTHFIRSIMDDTRFMRAPDGDGNILELTKRAMVAS